MWATLLLDWAKGPCKEPDTTAAAVEVGAASVGEEPTSKVRLAVLILALCSVGAEATGTR
jgi:hypothetical protein